MSNSVGEQESEADTRSEQRTDTAENCDPGNNKLTESQTPHAPVLSSEHSVPRSDVGLEASSLPTHADDGGASQNSGGDGVPPCGADPLVLEGRARFEAVVLGRYGDRGSSLLHVAASSGHGDVLTALLDAGCDPCVRDGNGKTPYTMAGTKDVRNVFRRFRGNHPDRFDYDAAQMSSSLKDRLKKCGRYHPATPPSSRHTTPVSTPTSSRRTPPRPGPDDAAGDRSPSHPSTPVCRRSTPSVRPHCDSPTGTRRTLPRPRNILKEEKCGVSRSRCQNGKGDFESDSEPATGCLTSVIVRDEENSELCDPDGAHEEMCTSPESSSPKPQSEAAAVISASTSVTDSSTIADTASVEKRSGGDREDAGQKVSAVKSGAELREAKKKLTADLTRHKEMLRKLLIVKTYRAKHSLVELQGLIEKWRSVSQEAILDLHQLTRESQPSLTRLVGQLGVDGQLLRYDVEDECFEED